MLNLVWVRTFLALIEHRSFQAAAERLGVAQPTVSLHIQKLEEQLGVVLFLRARSGCTPTAAATALLPYAHGLMRLHERAITAAQRQQVRVGASSNIGIYLLPPHVRAFLAGRDPDDFDLVIDRNPVIARRLADGEVDIAVMEWWDRRPGFRAARWKSEPVVLIVPPGHAFARRLRIEKEELAGLALLGGEPGTGTGRLLEAYFGTAGAMPRVSLQLGSTEAVKQAVKAGLGISLVLAAAVTEDVRSGSLCAVPLVEPALAKDLFVVWREDRPHTAPPAFAQHLLAPAGVPAGRGASDKQGRP